VRGIIWKIAPSQRPSVPAGRLNLLPLRHSQEASRDGLPTVSKASRLISLSLWFRGGTPGRTSSVTSVRCSPRCTSYSPRNQTVHQRAFRRPASIPLCDLRDLCAMLSPKRVFLAQKPNSPPNNLPPPSFQSPLCDLRDLCAMLSPKRVFLAQKPNCPTKEPSAVPPQSPSVTSVTSVRCSCPMHVFLAQQPN
jgi:hypothetical protein